jgi:hypothetical protein
MVLAGPAQDDRVFHRSDAGPISVILFLYIDWVLLNWRTGILLFLGVLLLAIVLSGLMLKTLFLVREIRRSEQHDAFINAVTHEFKTPVPRRRTFVETRRTYILRGSNRWDRVTLKEMVSHP